MNFNKKRKAFTIIEVILATILISILSAALMKSLQNTREKRERKNEYTRAIQFEKAIKSNFSEIIDLYSRTTVSTGSSKHGWSSLSSSSAFPRMTASTQLVYELDMSPLSATQRVHIRATIDESLRGVCFFGSTVGTQIRYTCPRITSFSMTNSHPLGTSIDPTRIPTVSFVYRRTSSLGDVIDPVTLAPDVAFTNQRYSFDLTDEFEHRRKISTVRMSEIRSALRSFFNLKLSREVKNKGLVGLNSDDDTFVPWQWLLMSSLPKATILQTECDRTTYGGNCFSANAWVGGSGHSTEQMTNAVVRNLLNDDGRYLVDGFGNMIHVHLLYNVCPKNMDTATCILASPAMPKGDYSGNGGGIPAGVVLPPFTATIFIDHPTFRDDTNSLQTANAAEYGRIYLAF